MIFVMSLVLILASLVFFSIGAALRAGKHEDIKPQIHDVIIVLLLWVAAVFTAIYTEFNRWALFGGWAGVCIVIGFLAALFKTFPENPYKKAASTAPATGNILKRAWRVWRKFTEKMAGFQTRILFSLLFLILIAPIALVLKSSKDPVSKKGADIKSYWLTRGIASYSLENFRKQS